MSENQSHIPLHGMEEGDLFKTAGSASANQITEQELTSGLQAYHLITQTVFFSLEEFKCFNTPQ